MFQVSEGALSSNRILLANMGYKDRDILREIAWHVNRRFGVEVITSDLFFPECSSHGPERETYAASLLLSYLRKFSGDDVRVLGITDVDLSFPGLNYIFGLSDPPSGVSVVSGFRFRSRDGSTASERVRNRMVKTSIHELGHLFGLSHCKQRTCVMSFSFTVGDTDYKSAKFCERCAHRLQRFDLLDLSLTEDTIMPIGGMEGGRNVGL
jgi:archaemetzincin